ncbi:hypothetical protein GCM10010521_48480 [Streptomyces rameus]|uniref:Uncharacterized protein n=1 Tax=Streptomyces rameus TaxID=68261 RepID=A0ABP6NPE7_9ACTN
MGLQPVGNPFGQAFLHLRAAGEVLDKGRGRVGRGPPGRLGPERGLTACERLLDQYGYEPVRESPAQLRLATAPSIRWPPRPPTWCAA